MQGTFRPSEAASLAIHAVMLLKIQEGTVLTVHDMAEQLQASEAHLSKVMQRLARARIVKSHRGPRGGFALAARKDDTTLLDVYEAIEGPFTTDHCLFESKVCLGDRCALGGMLERVNNEVKQYLASTRLSDL